MSKSLPEEASDDRERRSPFGYLLRAVISITLLIWAFMLVDFTRLREALTPALAWATLASAVLITLSAAPQSERWRLISEAIGSRLARKTAFRITLLSYFMLGVTPSTVGADGVRMMAMREGGASWTHGLAVILADRIYGFAAILILGVVGWPFIAIASPHLIYSVALPLIFLSAVAVTGGLVLNARAPRAWMRNPWARRFARFIRAINLIMADIRLASHCLFLALLALGASVASFFLIAHAAGTSGGIVMVLAVFPATLLLGFLPISVNGWGLREVSLVAMMGAFEVGPGAALATSLAYGVSVSLSGVFGLLAWWLIPAHQASKTPREEPA